MVTIETQKVAPCVGPSFRNPPVVETALGIQFAELNAFRATHFGLFWERIRDRFPVVEDRPRLNHIPFPSPAPLDMPALAVAFALVPLVNRVWYRNEPNGEELVQLQPDRFGFNWKRPVGDREYPRFAKNAETCLNLLDEFVEFARENDLGEIKPDLCEVVYVNHIRSNSPDRESTSALFGRLFSGLSWTHSDEYLPPLPQAAVFNRVWSMDGNDGRLYAEATIATDKTSGEFVLFKLTGRAVCADLAAVADKLQLAHDWVVNAFVSLTDEKMRRREWGQHE